MDKVSIRQILNVVQRDVVRKLDAQIQDEGIKTRKRPEMLQIDKQINALQRQQETIQNKFRKIHERPIEIKVKRIKQAIRKIEDRLMLAITNKEHEAVRADLLKLVKSLAKTYDVKIDELP